MRQRVVASRNFTHRPGPPEPTAPAWLQAGSFGLGFVASLFDAEDLRLRRFDQFQQRAARMVAEVRAHGPTTVH